MKDFARLYRQSRTLCKYNRNGARYARCYYTNGMVSMIWPIDSCHFQWPWITEGHLYVARFFEYNSTNIFSNISHGCNWHSASRSPWATAELLVLFTVVAYVSREAHASDIQSTFMLCLDLRRSFALSATHRCCIRRKSIASLWIPYCWQCLAYGVLRHFRLKMFVKYEWNYRQSPPSSLIFTRG